MVGADVSTKYSMRGEEQYGRIVGYIEKVVKLKKGNYMVFFPSYQMMELIYERAKERIPNIFIVQPIMYIHKMPQVKIELQHNFPAFKMLVLLQKFFIFCNQAHYH